MEKKKEEWKSENQTPDKERKKGRSRKYGSTEGKTNAERMENTEVQTEGNTNRLEESANPSEGSDGKRHSLAGIAAAAAILAVGGSIGGYLTQVLTYQNHFLPNTIINGIDVSKMNVEEVEHAIERGLSGYELKILERTETEEVIKTEEIGLHSEFDGSLEQILKAQEPMKWIKNLWSSSEYEIETMLSFDEELLKERVQNLSCMDLDTMIKPENARLSEYQSESKSYEIIPEKQGTELIEERVLEAVRESVMNLRPETDLDAEGCYTKPEVNREDEKLCSLAAELNRYVGAAVNHTFGDKKETLDGDTIREWLTIEESGVTFDESGAERYVRALAKKYNTAYSSKNLKTSYGTTVTVPAGPYGWRMNETKETAAVLEAVKAGNQVTREPEWIQTAASHGENDYGDTYVEINLTAQHLFFYKDGKLVVEADFVSGNAAKGWATPAGAFPLTYKQRNATLRGENYATPVSYWMPFNGNIGMHDAGWRSSFGGTIYKKGGSHGCVNLPPKAAKLIFESISAGDPVLCYHLEGTETKDSSSTTLKPSEAVTTAAPVTLPSTETTLAETVPSTETPTETVPTEMVPIETVPIETSGEQPPYESASASESIGMLTPETSAASSTEGAGPAFSQNLGSGGANGPGAPES